MNRLVHIAHPEGIRRTVALSWQNIESQCSEIKANISHSNGFNQLKDFSIDEAHTEACDVNMQFIRNGEVDNFESVSDFDEYGDDDDDDDSDDDDSTDTVIPISYRLAEWASNHNITHKALDALLEIERDYHPGIPADARTLLKTPQNYVVRHMSDQQGQ